MMDRVSDRAEEILGFWFGAEGDSCYGEFRKEWFQVDPAFDDEIRRRFVDVHGEARRGSLDAWQRTPEGTLALVILLDQFSRNMFRGTPGMYESDPVALAVAKTAVDAGVDQKLPEFQRWFLYMPLMHSEDLDDQRRCLELFRGVGDTRHAEEHLAVIERFGRFPHRNEILGRESTPEELDFLRRNPWP